MTDRLTLTRALESSGMQSAAAEHIATEIYDAIHNNVATKQDLQQLETALRADVEAMEQRLERKIDTMVNRLVAAMVVTLGLLFGALHLWPPHP